MLHDLSSSDEEDGIRRTVALNAPRTNAQRAFPSNATSTTKYNVFTFLPKNLFEQFRRCAAS